MATLQIVSPTSRSGLEKCAGYYRDGDQIVEHGMSDSLLAAAYLRFQRDELLPVLFYENPMTLLEFLGFYLKPQTYTLGCYRVPAGGGTLELCGMLWINDRIQMGKKHARANVGMGFFRGSGGITSLVNFANIGIEWAFDNLKIDSLFGITPAKNRAAVIFGQKLGFEQFGPIPNGTVWNDELCDTYLSSMPIATWNEIRPWGRR